MKITIESDDCINNDDDDVDVGGGRRLVFKIKKVTKKQKIGDFFEKTRTKHLLNTLVKNNELDTDNSELFLLNLTKIAENSVSVGQFLQTLKTINPLMRDVVDLCARDLKEIEKLGDFEPVTLSPSDILHPDTFMENNTLSKRMRLAMRIIVNRSSLQQ